ncbi:MAG TPA: S8 family serine peptidase [Fibrobacteria bacterium]|nr:S8 family serine peptidase [Fibrobacteria bacterium]
MRPFRFPFRTLFAGSSLAFALALPGAAGAERIKAWVTLRDKGPAAASLSGRALEDAPVSAAYLDALRASGFEVSVALKWQNKVSGWLDDSRVSVLRALPFVSTVEEMPRKASDSSFGPAFPPSPALPRRAASAKGAKVSAQDFGAFQPAFEAVGAVVLRDTVAGRGLAPGAGIRVAVMDDGFHLGHKAFDSLFARGAIIDQWDFVGDTAVSVDRSFGDSHGASTLSQIAGDLPGVLQGLAPRATFLLYRTEDEDHEGYVEEDYLAAALERAADSGAQVASISLSYRYDFDTEAYFPYAQMNGRTRPSSIAALGAARRGVLVVSSIGNEGAKRYGEPTLTAPSDADSILAVGILDASGTRCGYSSTGPSYDGRIKPDLSSFGCSVPVANPSTSTGVYNESGTSFAAPVVAGVAILLRQLYPESSGVFSSQHIRLALMATAARASSPDNQTGNGRLNAAAAERTLKWSVPPASLAAAPRSVKGALLWRSGSVASLPWTKGLDLSGARVWDVRGRGVPTRAETSSITGGTDLLPSRIEGTGIYVLKIPLSKP